MSRPTSLYKSEAWLRKKYLSDKMTPDQIAKVCGCQPMTIYRYLNKFGLIKK